MELINKDSLLAAIDKRIKVLQKHPMENHKTICHLDSVKQSVNSLEVKEVDLEEELESFAYTLPHSAIGDGEHLGKFDDPKVKEARKHGWSHLWRYNYVKKIAKHFFELGLNVSNPITEKNIESFARQVIDLYIEAGKHYDNVIKEERNRYRGSDLVIKLISGAIDPKELGIQYVLDKLKTQKEE